MEASGCHCHWRCPYTIVVDIVTITITILLIIKQHRINDQMLFQCKADPVNNVIVWKASFLFPASETVARINGDVTRRPEYVYVKQRSAHLVDILDDTNDIIHVIYKNSVFHAGFTDFVVL